MIRRCHTTPAGTSVLDDLGIDEGFAVKSRLAIRIAKSVKELGLNQQEAATLMGITRAELSRLARGKFRDLSEGELEECLVALGRLRVRAATRDHSMEDEARDTPLSTHSETPPCPSLLAFVRSRVPKEGFCELGLPLRDAAPEPIDFTK